MNLCLRMMILLSKQKMYSSNCPLPITCVCGDMEGYVIVGEDRLEYQKFKQLKKTSTILFLHPVILYPQDRRTRKRKGFIFHKELFVLFCIVDSYYNNKGVTAQDLMSKDSNKGPSIEKNALFLSIMLHITSTCLLPYINNYFNKNSIHPLIIINSLLVFDPLCYSCPFSSQIQQTSLFSYALIYLLRNLQFRIQVMYSPTPMTGKKIENFVFNYSDFLGNGNFSKCYKAHNTKTNEEVAIKIVQLNSLKSKKLEELLFSEIEVLKEMNHPNVLRCHQVFTSNRNCYIITELCNEGDLEGRIKKKQKLEEWEINNIIADVYRGLKYLASKNIVHRDLKIANIFMHNGVAKIADFGFALHSKVNFKDLNIGSPLYMSPQGILNNVYGPKTDVWAFGIMVYELYHGKTPFNSCQTEEELQISVTRQLQWNQLKSDIPNEVKQLTLNCLQVREEKRLTIVQLANNSYLQRVLNNRQSAITPQLKFKSPIKLKEHKLLEAQQPVRGRSHMKMRSAFSAQEHSFQTNRPPPQRMISPNKTFIMGSNTQNGFQTVNSSFNFHSVHNSFQATQKTNVPNMIINFPGPQTKKSVAMNDRSFPGQIPVQSPVQFAEETLNCTQHLPPSKKVYLISGQINFKQCVSILHYCRLIFKYLQCYKQQNLMSSQSEKQHYALLAQFLIFSLDQIFELVSKKRVKYEGQNPEMREKKLFQVTDEYRNKYNKELDNDLIKRMLDETKRSELSLNFIQHIASSQSASLTLNETSTTSQIIIGQLLLVIYSSTLLLEQCYLKKSYSQFQKYKQIQQTLNKPKDSFAFHCYLKNRNRVFDGRFFSMR